MKNICFILSIFCLVWIHSYAQFGWAPQSAIWTYGGQGQMYSYIEIKYNKDTLLLGKTCKVLQKTLYTYDDIKGNIFVSDLGEEITYEHDSTIYLYQPNEFDTLYVFNSAIGDSWKLYCWNNARAIVQDTGTMQINDRSLKYIAIEYSFDSLGTEPYIVHDTIIERIGPTQLYFLPCDIIKQMTDGNEGSRLRCYYDDQLGLYKNHFDKPCDYFTAIKNIPNDEIKVYPVPCHDQINLEFSNNEIRHIKIQGFSGADLLNIIVSNRKCTINLSSFPPGIYILEISSQEGIYYKKILKSL